jgi:AraC-like DNA-binding protein
MYRELRASGALGRYVECFWFLEEGAGTRGAGCPIERLLPIGAIEAVLHRGSPFRQVSPEGAPRRLTAGVIAGQQTGPLDIQPEGPIATMGIRFLPGGAYPFLGMPLDALTDCLASFEDVWGAGGRRLEERLLDAPDDASRVGISEAFLLERLEAAARRDDAVEAAAGEIRRRRGRVRVADLSGASGVSARQLERRFATALGLPPKSLARIVRFQAMLRAIDRGARPDWAGLAADFGFCDQAHLVNEVRRLSGLTPRGLAARREAGASADPGFTLDAESGLRVCPAAARPEPTPFDVSEHVGFFQDGEASPA